MSEHAETKDQYEAGEGLAAEHQNAEGKIKIAEDVVAQLAVKALAGVEGVQPANSGLMANLRLGRKSTGGVRITVTEGDEPEIQVDTYVTVKYGLRIPDVCWDVQEAVKTQVEKFTGYTVKGVNVYVQGVSFSDKKEDTESETEGD